MSERIFPIRLHPGQAAVYNSKARFKVVAAGRRFGKSHYAAIMLGQEALRTTNDAGYQLTIEHGVYYVAPTFDQAKRIMWPKLRTILGFHRNGGFIVNENVNDGWIELENGRRIYIKGADNEDSLRGIGLSYVVLDEYADMKANVWDDILEPALLDVEGSALFIGTPKGKNHFYKLFMGALSKPVNPETGENSNWDHWEAFHFKSMDNPFLNRKELARQMNDPRKSRDTIRQELEASFISGGAKVLKPEHFDIVPHYPHVIEGNLYVAVDLAGFVKDDGGKISRTDETVVCIVLAVKDKWYVIDMIHGHFDARKCAWHIIQAARRFPGARLGIEAGALKNAVQPYLEDYMREFSRYVTAEPLLHGGTKKHDRIAWALEGRSQRRLIKLVKGEWNQWFLDQVADFPDKLSHDDGLDALAYVDQMHTTSYVEADDMPEPEVIDIEIGF